FPTLLRVPSPAPAPHHLEDPVIHILKGAFARRITVIHGPALDLLVQTLDHCSCRQAARVVDGFPDLGQERLDVLRRRLGQDLAAAMAPYVLPQEIEALLHMRDLGFLVRELKPSFFQEMGHERLDLITEKFLRRACDQEVIRIAHQVDFGLPLSLRRVREVFRQQPLWSMGTCVKSQSWLIRSKQALMSPSRIHCGPCRWLNKIWTCSRASAQRRSRRKL